MFCGEGVNIQLQMVRKGGPPYISRFVTAFGQDHYNSL